MRPSVERRGWQQADVDGAADTHRQADESCSASVSNVVRYCVQSTKCGPTSAATSARMMGYRNSKQGRLQSALRAPSVRQVPPGTNVPFPIHFTLVALMAANICRLVR